MFTILYVDDDPNLLEIGKYFLESTGVITIDTALSGKEGLERLKQNTYEAILSDYQMPGMDGIQFLKEVRFLFGDMPFILFTGKGREEVVIEAINNGADGYLQKGGDPDAQFTELSHKIRQIIQRRQAEEALRETNDYLTNLITYANAPIVTWDINCRITRFNRAFENLTGFSEAEVLGKDFDIIFPDTTRAQSLDLVCRALFGEKLQSVEIPVRTVLGEIRRVLWNSANIYGKDGKTLVSTIAQGVDITDLMRAEDVLKESEAKFRSIVETSPDMVWQIDTKGHFTYMSPQATHLLGVAPEDLIGKSIFSLGPAENKSMSHVDFSQFLEKKGLPAVLEIPAVHQDGRQRIIEIRAASIIGERGERLGFRGIARDITDARQASDTLQKAFQQITMQEEELRKQLAELGVKEQALQESERKFRTIVESSPYPICVNSLPDGKFVEVNAAFLQASGYSEAEVLGKSPVDIGFLSLIDFGRLASHLLVSGKLENVPMALTGKGGIRVHVLFSTIPVTLNDQQAILTMTVEVTKLKRVEEELLSKNEELTAAFEELTAIEEELRQNFDRMEAFQKNIKESEARFRTLFTISPDGILLFDLAGRITFASPEALKMFKVSSPDEAIGTNVFDWVEPEYHDGVREAIVQLLDGKLRRAITYKVRRRDGSSFLVETSQGVIPDANGNPEGFMVIVRDITGRQ